MSTFNTNLCNSDTFKFQQYFAKNGTNLNCSDKKFKINSVKCFIIIGIYMLRNKLAHNHKKDCIMVKIILVFLVLTTWVHRWQQQFICILFIYYSCDYLDLTLDFKLNIVAEAENRNLRF